MAAFLDDRPLVAGVNEDWDDVNTCETPRHRLFTNSDENNASLAPDLLRHSKPCAP